jgi:hypothetical protein
MEERMSDPFAAGHEAGLIVPHSWYYFRDGVHSIIVFRSPKYYVRRRLK